MLALAFGKIGDASLFVLNSSCNRNVWRRIYCVALRMMSGRSLPVCQDHNYFIPERNEGLNILLLLTSTVKKERIRCSSTLVFFFLESVQHSFCGQILHLPTVSSTGLLGNYFIPTHLM